MENDVDKSIKRSSCVLDCQRFKGTHSFDKIAEVLSDIFSNYGLKHEQIVSTITDNASNFVKAFNEFGVPLQIIEPDEEGIKLNLAYYFFILVYIQLFGYRRYGSGQGHGQ